MRTDDTISPTVEGFMERARGIPTVDIPQDVRDAAMRLKSDVRRTLKEGSLSEDEAGHLHDLMIGLDTLHRGRVPLVV